MSDAETAQGAQGRLKYERLEFFFHRHWICFAKLLLQGLLIALLAIILLVPMWILMNRLGIVILDKILGFVMMIGVYIAFSYIFIPLMNYFFEIVLVTDCRMIIAHKTIFLRNDHDTIDLTKIQDIGVESRGIFTNYLNYGRLVITLSSVNMPIVIRHAPRPHDVLERINRIKRIHIINRQEKRKPLSEAYKDDTLKEEMPAYAHDSAS